MYCYLSTYPPTKPIIQSNANLIPISGFYPYPIFSILSTPQRIGLFAGSGVAMWAVGAGLRWCYQAINGIEADLVREARAEERKAR